MGILAPVTAPTLPPPLSRRGTLNETWLVLGVSLGASAIWAVLSIIRKVTAEVSLSAQTTSMNTSVTPDRPWLDLAFQLTRIGLALVPVLLALHLLRRDDPRPGASMGFDLRRPVYDLITGLGLTALIGLPGLGLYVLSRELGLNTTVSAANLTAVWWAVPVLILAAMQNAILEEVIMIGYLFRRWGQAGLGTWQIIFASALIRGTYHLYQGFGGFAGNMVMGVVFGWIYTRTKRVMPLVIAHTLLDVIAFVGYTLLRDTVSWL
ncbi:MAG: CPBP family intramembrane metalloprotease [Actinomycetales bacterium]|nr:CPBP family intramembrane metalloprotease [Actinomycetales bacterium]